MGFALAADVDVVAVEEVYEFSRHVYLRYFSDSTTVFNNILGWVYNLFHLFITIYTHPYLIYTQHQNY